MLNEMQQKVINMLKDTLGESEELNNLKPDDDLSALGVNSVTFIKLVIATELEFGIEFANEDLDFQNFATINKIVEYLSGFNKEEAV